MGLGGGQQGEGEQVQGPVAIQIGEASIPALDIEHQAQLMVAQQQPGGGSPKMEVFAIAQALEGSIQRAAGEAAANEIGPDLSDSSIREHVTKQVDKFIAEAKQRYIDEKKMKPTASAKEFDELFKKEMGGQTAEEVRKSAIENVTANLADPARKAGFLQQVAPQLAVEKLKASLKPTDEEVKASYDTYVMKRVMISTGSKTPADAEAQAKKALAEVKGGAKFEDVMNRYSNDLPPGPNKKVAEVVVNLGPTDIARSASMAPLANLKPGQVSEVIDVPDGKAFYKLISVKSNAPADLAKSMQKYKDKFVEEKATAEFQKRTDALAKSDQVKFPLPGYKSLRDYYKTSSDFTLMQKPEELSKQIRAIADAAKAATTDENPADDHVGLITWYAAVEDLWNRAKADPKLAEGLRAERLETLESVLRETENFSIRMELVDMGIETKNATLAATNLLEAAKLNNMFDTTGDQQFRQIQTKLATAKNAKLVTAAEATAIETEQQRWRTEKLANQQAEKQFKAEQEAEKKKAAAATKEVDAQQKKMADQVKKEIEQNKTPATTGTAVPPKSTAGGQ